MTLITLGSERVNFTRTDTSCAVNSSAKDLELGRFCSSPAEYVLSLAGMSEENFKEAITDQYSDLYWDEDLLHDMYEAVAGDLQPKT